MNWEYFIMNSLMDFKKLLTILGEKDTLNSAGNLYNIFPEMMKPVIEKVFDNNNKIISEFSVDLGNFLTSFNVNETSEQLQNVTANPRLFRGTNRIPPQRS